MWALTITRLKPDDEEVEVHLADCKNGYIEARKAILISNTTSILCARTRLIDEEFEQEKTILPEILFLQGS